MADNWTFGNANDDAADTVDGSSATSSHRPLVCG